MIDVYCYSRCSTCKKALKWLDEKGVKYRLFDLKEENPDENTIKTIYENNEHVLKKFFNTSGMVYRELGLSKKLATMDEEEQLKLLASDGMLVKRPLVVAKDKVLLGFKEDEWQTLIP